MMKLSYVVLMLTLLSLFIFPQKSYARNDYRFEHTGCIFSYIFPGAPSVIPIWRDDRRGYESFIRKLPLITTESMQGVKAEFKKVDMNSSDKILMQTYCMKFDKSKQGNVLSPDDMLGLLRDSIGALDVSEVKVALSREEINFTQQANGIRWMSIRADVQQVVNEQMVTVSHYRDVFSYKNQALLMMISFVDEDSGYQEVVDTLLRSLILAD